MSSVHRWLLAVAGIAVLAAGVWLVRPPTREPTHASRAPSEPLCGDAACRHVDDEAGVLPPADIPRFEAYMKQILQESDVDLRFLFVNNTSATPIEKLAVEKMQKLNIGGRDQERRGVLLLYDIADKQLRVEVGYGLESYFPDGFIGYLVRDHAQLFFSSGNPSLGLQLMLRLLQHRIREAVLGDEFDPRAIEALRKGMFLSGGAGTSSRMAADGITASATGAIDESRRHLYASQPSPEDAYQHYLMWLSGGTFDPNVELFTPESRRYLSRLPVSRAYFDFVFLAEFGKPYRVHERENLAILYFTGTPLVSPYFFRRDASGWRVDIVAAVRDTAEYSGGPFTWNYRGTSDDYTNVFRELLTTIDGFIRFADGDNRQLRTSASLR